MFYLQQGSFAVHILGLIFWIGGLLTLSRLLRVFINQPSERSELSPEIQKACKAIWYGFVLGGLGIVLLTGVVNISVLGVGYYMKQGWFHAKLALVFILLFVTALCGVQVSQASEGRVLARKTLAVIHGLAAGLTLMILLMTYVLRATS